MPGENCLGCLAAEAACVYNNSCITLKTTHTYTYTGPTLIYRPASVRKRTLYNANQLGNSVVVFPLSVKGFIYKLPSIVILHGNKKSKTKTLDEHTSQSWWLFKMIFIIIYTTYPEILVWPNMSLNKRINPQGGCWREVHWPEGEMFCSEGQSGGPKLTPYDCSRAKPETSAVTISRDNSAAPAKEAAAAAAAIPCGTQPQSRFHSQNNHVFM